MKTTIILLLAIIGVASATLKFRFRKKCYPPKIPQGSVLGKKYYYYVDSVISYKCSPGYYYKGTPKATCKYHYGKYTWYPSPKCYPVLCKVPVAPAMGGVSPQTGSSVKVGTSIKYYCKDTHSLVGSPTAKCLASGKFSSSAPVCEVKCTVPAAPTGGSVSPSTGNEVSVGKSIQYSCNTNFKLVGSPSAKCKDNGQFSSPTPSCQPIICTVPSAPNDGSVSPKAGSEVVVGKQVSYSCNTGFKLVGYAISTCKNDGQFSRAPPTCEPLKSCKRPYTAPGIKISPDHHKPYPHGSRVKHACKYGQLVGSHELRCDNGKWVGKAPTCEIYY